MRVWVLLIALLTALTMLIPLTLTQAGGTMAPPASGPDRTASSEAPAELAPPGAALSDWPRIVTPSEPPRPAAAPTVEGRESFAILDRSTGKVARLDARDYVIGALASEMPATFHAEALAAQAVAAHTWALYCAAWQAEHPDPLLKGADFDADPSHDEGYITEARARERYGESFDLYWPKLRAAADYALDRALTYDGRPILAAYHSTSAGTTESADNVWTASIPYLTPVESEGDRLAPDYEVREAFSRDELRGLLRRRFPEAVLEDGEEETWLVPLERSRGGYVTAVSVGGQEAHGKEVRGALSLRSSCFTVEYADGAFTIETAGYGHGVGLSQYGADFMARQGSDCEAILSHYYPGAALSVVTH